MIKDMQMTSIADYIANFDLANRQNVFCLLR